MNLAGPFLENLLKPDAWAVSGGGWLSAPSCWGRREARVLFPERGVGGGVGRHGALQGLR